MLIRQNCDNCKVFSKSFFSRLGKEDVAELIEKKSCLSYKKNQPIFTAGTRPNGIYCLNSGKLKIFKTGAYGKEQIIRFALPGELFGIRSLMSDKNYTSTAVTIEDSVVCFISKQDFMELLIKYPQITASIISSLSEMLEESNNKITSLAQKPIRERLAEALVTLDKLFVPEENSESTNTVISLSRQDMANLVGTATETIIRLLSEFKSDNLISIKGRKITILDVKGLHRIANL
jgi:CRP/FNR family transcriptional regulator, polysaccharide utilization system transcription regulator